MTPRLYTIPISHYGERARWALDHAGIAYDEVHRLQMFSWFDAKRLGQKKTLPVLVTGDETLTDSGDILAYAAARSAVPLYPADRAEREEVEALERELAGEYGVESRRVAYEWFFRARDTSLRYNAGHAPSAQARALRLFFPIARAFALRYLAVTAESTARGVAIVTRTMDAMARRLEGGSGYLVGDSFSAADLTFAAMSAPNVLPKGYGVPLPELDEIPEDAAERIRAWRAHPAGRFALRMYAEHRLTNRAGAPGRSNSASS